MISIPVVIPETAEDREVGLLALTSPPQGWGMLFLDASAIHMIGMQFPIDVIFFDFNWVVIDKVRAVPGEKKVSAPGAEHILELGPGAASSVFRGQQAVYQNGVLLIG